jgi:hypothetical protein
MNLHSMFWSMVYFVFPHDLEVISLSQTSIYVPPSETRDTYFVVICYHNSFLSTLFKLDIVIAHTLKIFTSNFGQI